MKYALLPVLTCAALTLSACSSTPPARVHDVPLVSSVQDYAPVTDEKLTDAWGLRFGHAGRIWLAGSSGISPVYDGDGNLIMTPDESGQNVPLHVEVPMAAGVTDEPAPLTGMVFNEDDAFNGDAFVFVTEQGTIAGWNKRPDGSDPLIATMRVDRFADGAVYKGVTQAKTERGWQLYAADFARGTVDVFDEHYRPVQLAGNFTDPNLPEGYAPFNIEEIGDTLFVTFAKQSIDKQNDVHSPGNGYISVFDTNGMFKYRFASKGALNSPWGMALAPGDFGSLSGLLLVGNFGDGRINMFNPQTSSYLGYLADENGDPVQIDGLWSLTFGTDNGAGKHNELFYAAGPSAEDQGVFGKLELLP